MTPEEKVGLWWLRFLCFFVIFFGALFIEIANDFMLLERFSSVFGYISEARWDDLVIGGCTFFSVLFTCLATLIVSGKSEAGCWLLQISVYLVLFTGIYAGLPEHYVSFVPLAGGALALTSLLIWVGTKRPNKQYK